MPKLYVSGFAPGTAVFARAKEGRVVPDRSFGPGARILPNDTMVPLHFESKEALDDWLDLHSHKNDDIEYTFNDQPGFASEVNEPKDDVKKGGK